LTRRRLAAAAAIALAPVALGTLAFSEGPRKLYVYVPSDVRPAVLEKALAAAIPKASIAVFARIRDFETAIAESPPDCVLTSRPLVERRGDFKPVLQGLTDKQPEERYVLVSVGKAADPARVGEIELGVVEILGKRDMADFVAKLVGAPGAVNLKRVAKPEDLLPLLQFQLVGAVLIPLRTLKSLREKSALDLRVTEVKTANVGLPALAASPAGRWAEIQASVSTLSAEVKAMLGVEEWRRL
jgi:hypothetical protein